MKEQNEQPAKIGQTWKRLTDGLLIEIVSITEDRDCEYVIKGPQTKPTWYIYEYNLVRLYRLVEG